MKHKHHNRSNSSVARPQWLDKREGYPDEAEREAIVAMRRKLQLELISLMVRDVKPTDAQGKQLMQKYGSDEVDRALKLMGDMYERPVLVGDETYLYRQYRLRYAQSGDGQPFLSYEEFDELSGELLTFFGKELNGEKLGDTVRWNELKDILLDGWDQWNDLVPPAVPARPDGFAAPQARQYSAPVSDLLGWGSTLDLMRIEDAALDVSHWQKHIPALANMVLDEGLLEGWPGESASWAPWHALMLLGELGAWEHSARLVALAGRKNDWLSDVLVPVWVKMGLAVEPVLWALLDDASLTAEARGLAANALHKLVEDEGLPETKLVNELSKRLLSPKYDDRELNGYILFILNALENDDSIDAIVHAFDEDKVDPAIITLEDFEWIAWNDDADEDEE